MRARDVQWVIGKLAARPEFAHYRNLLSADTLDAYCEDLAEVTLSADELWHAVRRKLIEDPVRLPDVRRAAYEALGVLAPDWDEAQATLQRYVRDRTMRLGYGPLRDAVDARGLPSPGDDGAAYWAQLRAAYEAAARRHDVFVMQPGGLALFAEVCEFFAAKQRQRELWQLACEAMTVLAPGSRMVPPPDTPAEELAVIVAQAERKLGMTLAERAAQATVQRDLSELFRPPRQLGGGS